MEACVFRKRKKALALICLAAFSLVCLAAAFNEDAPSQYLTRSVTKIKSPVSSSPKTKVEKSFQIAFSRPEILAVDFVEAILTAREAGAFAFRPFLSSCSNRAPPVLS
ncbi:MAG: hypothetical protein A4E57_02044 [Syntrophorhabdaceae bacterium PtaU1.Bin034]|nr:MAG: hypothetical protein A4E57_02044 [Syntrophorhabdaceae bacterium PtaU1.Bin034]